jgi:hypothetical protein
VRFIVTTISDMRMVAARRTGRFSESVARAGWKKDNSLVLVEIDLAGDNGLASHNDVANSGQAAILIEGNGNKVQGNDITEAPIGVLKLSGTIGNSQSGDSFFDTLIPVQDPEPAHTVHVAPQRWSSDPIVRRRPTVQCARRALSCLAVARPRAEGFSHRRLCPNELRHGRCDSPRSALASAVRTAKSYFLLWCEASRAGGAEASDSATSSKNDAVTSIHVVLAEGWPS